MSRKRVIVDIVKEANLLHEVKYCQWGGDVLLETGNTELFDRDILGLDND